MAIINPRVHDQPAPMTKEESSMTYPRQIEMHRHTTLGFVIKVSIVFIMLSATSVCYAEIYDFPFKRDDFTDKERVRSSSHNLATAGVQGEGYDLWMLRYVGNKNWSDLRTDGAENINKNHVAYERNIYAIADGAVVGCWRNAPENPRPKKSTDPEAGKEWLHSDFVSGLIPGGGNMLFVQHTDGTIALYAHFKPGTIPEQICPVNDALFPRTMTIPEGDQFVKDTYSNLPPAQQAKITKGNFLGQVGNSGNSGRPHLHLHVEKGGSPVMMRFSEGLSKTYSAGNTEILDGWQSFSGQQIPHASQLVQPPRANKYRMSDIELYIHGNSVHYAGIMKSGNYGPMALFKDNWNDFLQGWRQIESSGYRMKDLEVYNKGNKLHYAGIFEPGNYNPVALFKDNWNDFLQSWQHFE
jgi:hypothetical protein